MRKKKITTYENFNKKKENYDLFKIPNVKTHEVLCSDCEGTGYLPESTGINKKGKTYLVTCKKCWGSGKLSWLENVLGRN